MIRVATVVNMNGVVGAPLFSQQSAIPANDRDVAHVSAISGNPVVQGIAAATGGSAVEYGGSTGLIFSCLCIRGEHG